MRRIVLAEHAQQNLEQQIRYIAEQGEHEAAITQRAHFYWFLESHLAHWPQTGKKVDGTTYWQSVVLRTSFVIWYVFSNDELTVLDVWHTRQNRR